MVSRGALRVLFVLLGVGAAAACADAEPPDVPTYGPPGALPGKVPNEPYDAGGAATTTPPPSGDAGTVTGDGGGAGAEVACQKSGGTLVTPSANCAVSWTNDIYPNMLSGAAWNCAGTGCHVTTAPVLSGGEHGFYVALANYTGTTTAALPYINPCTKDPAQSDFTCSLLPAGTAGACGTSPMPLGAPPIDAGGIATWVACGAPEN